MTRLDEPLFPVLALREAVVNAICHRDYSIVAGAINIAIFEDRLQIITGELPFGQPPAWNRLRRAPRRSRIVWHGQSNVR